LLTQHCVPVHISFESVHEPLVPVVQIVVFMTVPDPLPLPEPLPEPEPLPDPDPLPEPSADSHNRSCELQTRPSSHPPPAVHAHENAPTAHSPSSPPHAVI
jgi:hypothetical protein